MGYACQWHRLKMMRMLWTYGRRATVNGLKNLYHNISFKIAYNEHCEIWIKLHEKSNIFFTKQLTKTSMADINIPGITSI